MLAKQAVGQGAASRKYDVLTALGTMACAETSSVQRTILRFMTLITARYNWMRDELSIGRADIARLWQVNERTVKRELAKLKTRGWLTVKRPAARGRVTVYGIDWASILEASRPTWANVGPDLEARLGGAAGSAPEPVRAKVVAFPTVDTAGQGGWGRAAAILQGEDPAFYANWCAGLETAGVSDGVLELIAPSAFHAQYLQTQGYDKLFHAVRRGLPEVQRMVVAGQRPG